MVFYTADHHFGHGNIIRHCKRPFSSVEDMDAALINNWNVSVGQNDRVYILGDLFFRPTIPAEVYLQKLNGRKHLIPGNHDFTWMKGLAMSDYFEAVTNILEIVDDGNHIVLYHAPPDDDLADWSSTPEYCYMVHGHIHNNTDTDIFPIIRNIPNILNAGVDINHFRPVTFQELIINNKIFKKNREISKIY